MLADPDEVDGELTKVLVKLPETGRQILTGLDVVYDLTSLSGAWQKRNCTLVSRSFAQHGGGFAQQRIF